VRVQRPVLTVVGEDMFLRQEGRGAESQQLTSPRFLTANHEPITTLFTPWLESSTPGNLGSLVASGSVRMARVPDPGFNRRVAALVLKTGDYRLHHGGLGVIRTLGRAGIAVYGVHEDAFTPAACSAYLRGGFVWRTGGQLNYRCQLLQGMGYVAERIGGPCVIVPTDDHAAVFVNECASELPHHFILPACRPGLALDLVNKRRCADVARRLGFPVPRTSVMRCPASKYDLKDVDLPIVVKRAQRALMPDGSRTYSTVIANNLEQLVELTGESGEEYDVLLQEVIPGRPGDDWVFHAYCNAESMSLVSFTGRKLRSYPAYAGETAYARSEYNPELREQAEHFLKSIGFVGIVGMDLRYDRRDGSYKMLDVNPRIGANFRMFENVYDIDVVRAFHLDLSGQSVPIGPQRDGRIYVVENYDIRTRHAYIPRRELSLAMWLRTLYAADERAWLAADDLIPVGMLGLRSVISERWLRREPTVPHYFEGRAPRPSLRP
jgi:D-aspartate ligase